MRYLIGRENDKSITDRFNDRDNNSFNRYNNL